MDTNHFFSFSRIAMVMKREIIENWKKNLYAFIGLYAAFALVVVGNMWGMSMNAENAFASPDIFFVRYCTNILGAFIFICLLGSLIYASGILDNMRNKEMRISFLMLPATMLEKYVARFLMATLGFIIAAIVGMLLAEVTRYILLPLFDLPDVFHSSALFKVFSMLTIDGEQAFRGSYAFNMEYMPWLGEACGWSFLIWSHSLYVLGGSFWYKRAFLKTLGTLIVISILGSIITVQIVEWIGEEGMMGLHDWLEENFQWMTLNKLLAFGGAFFSAFTMFNWWLGYKLFTRSQVIKPKESKSIYLQIADRICDEILQGQYPEEERIPSVREYAGTVEVNANTVVRTYDYLQGLEIIYNKRGIGYFVSTGAKERIITLRKDTFLHEDLPEFFRQLKTLEISMDEIDKMYKKYLEQQ